MKNERTVVRRWVIDERVRLIGRAVDALTDEEIEASDAIDPTGAMIGTGPKLFLSSRRRKKLSRSGLTRRARLFQAGRRGLSAPHECGASLVRDQKSKKKRA